LFFDWNAVTGFPRYSQGLSSKNAKTLHNMGPLFALIYDFFAFEKTQSGK
jgi:hypothetical protein